MVSTSRTWGSFASEIPSDCRSKGFKKSLLSDSFKCTLDRVNVLGDNSTGHTGCVNALSWAADGSYLLSGGDDRTVCIWRMDTSDATTRYPFVSTSVIYTGHTANIFNAQMLPNSSRLATVAGDKQVRVFDVEHALGQLPNEAQYESRGACTRVLRCHTGRCKRIVMEDSPDLFLTVAEDGCVRQHDLRTSHTCGSACPAPLIKIGHSLSTLALSPLTPYQFVVAGEAPHGYLFDRRHAGRFLNEEWGRVLDPADDDMVTCVRRFGRPPNSPGKKRRREHITGARMCASNGHEVLLSYSADAVYLYSTRDSPGVEHGATSTPILPPNDKRQETSSSDKTGDPIPRPDTLIVDEEDEEDDDEEEEVDEDGTMSLAELITDTAEEDSTSDDVDRHHMVPVILPRRRYAGACNVDTVKDVNFLGPNDEYVTSGSDDGNFFIWRKDTEAVAGVYEGDSTVVNVIEAHPHLPVVAVSGIDTTVKLFAPMQSKTNQFSKMSDLEAITQRNAKASRRSPGNWRLDFAHLFLHYYAFMQGHGGLTEQ